MLAKRLTTTVSADGSVTVPSVPAPPGTAVEVIVLVTNAREEQPVRSETQTSADLRYPLRGSRYRFDDPFSPVGAE